MIVCLDLEGVLTPEVWIHVARKTGVKALTRTTRDEPNYDKLMRYRIRILKKHKIKLKDIQRVISRLKVLPGSKSFLRQLKAKAQVVILSDTFYEFARPFMKQLDDPTLFCHSLKVSRSGYMTGYQLRQKDSKARAVRGLKKLNFEVIAAGDSYNDISMLKAADRGVLFKPPGWIAKQFRQFRVARNYKSLLRALLR